MPQTRSNGVQTPVNADTFNLTGDLATLAESITSIVPAASQSAGDTVATNRATAGFAVTDAKPLFIYNTTTKTIQVKDSSGWRDFNSPLGLIAESTNNTSSPGLSGSSIMCDNVTVNLVSGRWYRATYTVTTVSTSGVSDAIAYVFNKSVTTDGTIGGTSVTDGTQRFFYTAPYAGNSATVTISTHWKASATETQYLKIILARSTGASLYAINSRVLTVEDLGANF